MSEAYTPAGGVGTAVKRATVGEAATGTHGDEFMRQNPTTIADKIRFLKDSGHLQFPAAAIADADANVLDDYEEGTFTPIVLLGGANVGMTFTSQVGTYTKVGNRVYFQLYILLSAKGSSVGGLQVAGLPFVSNGGSNRIPAVAIWADTLAAVVGSIKGYVQAGTTQIVVLIATNGSLSAAANTNLNNTSACCVAGHYDV